MELFSHSGDSMDQPLAARMRPRTLDEYIGQDHIVGRGRLLRRAIQADQLSSLIFYGPPGTGKTTLAMVIANTTKSSFASLNAVLTGVKQLRETIDEAKKRKEYYGHRTILFVDEVHRWNKAQQDALLPWVENGTVILIGATTENPFFEVNRPLVSRSRIFQLTPLTSDDLRKIADQALQDRERGYGSYTIEFEPGALEHLIEVADGDARSLLNALELAVETTPDRFPPPAHQPIYISTEIAEESIQRKVVLYDKEGDYHFDTISAFIKSLRGSDPDAALYWLAKMVEAGEDPGFLFRRMLILAGEDVGMADPHAMVIVEAAAASFDRIGMPEGRYHLTHAALYLATCPKSNSAMGFFDALDTVRNEPSGDVPDHLKDANRDKEGFGHGKNYLYPHAYRDHWVAQQYLPSALQGQFFYRPSNQGHEATIREEVVKKREAQLEAGFDAPSQEILTYSPREKTRERWFQRLTEGRGAVLSSIRETLFASLSLKRHFRLLIMEQGAGFLVWEGLRRTPEGGTWVLSRSNRQSEIISRYAESLSETERPIIVEKQLSDFASEASKEPGEGGPVRFEAIAGFNALLRNEDKKQAVGELYSLLAGEGELSLAEAVPYRSTRLSSFLQTEMKDRSLLPKIYNVEEILYSLPDNPLTNWREKDIEDHLRKAGFSQITLHTKEYAEQRYLTEKDIREWLKESDNETTYGTLLKRTVTTKEYAEIEETLLKTPADRSLEWKRTILFIHAVKTEKKVLERNG